MKLKKWLGALALAAPAVVLAGSATATRQDVCMGGGGDSDGCSYYDTTITVTVNIDPADVGKPGAFFIGARETNGQPGYTNNINKDTVAMWLLTPTEGWVGFNGGRYEPFEISNAMPSRRVIVPINRQNLCQFIGYDRNIELWAGYGVLSPDKERAVNEFHRINNPRIPPDHIRGVYVYEDMKSGQKYWNVLNAIGCNPYRQPSDGGVG